MWSFLAHFGRFWRILAAYECLFSTKTDQVFGQGIGFWILGLAQTPPAWRPLDWSGYISSLGGLGK
jgi:hypothetical protein